MKENDYVYTAKLTRNLDLRANAQIELRYPLIGDKPDLEILNIGTNPIATFQDTIDINVPLGKERKPDDSINVAGILRTIADSIDAHK